MKILSVYQNFEIIGIIHPNIGQVAINLKTSINATNIVQKYVLVRYCRVTIKQHYINEQHGHVNHI